VSMLWRIAMDWGLDTDLLGTLGALDTIFTDHNAISCGGVHSVFVDPDTGGPYRVPRGVPRESSLDLKQRNYLTGLFESYSVPMTSWLLACKCPQSDESGKAVASASRGLTYGNAFLGRIFFVPSRHTL